MVAIIFTLMSFKFYIFQNLIMSSAKAIVLNDKLYWFLFWKVGRRRDWIYETRTGWKEKFSLEFRLHVEQQLNYGYRREDHQRLAFCLCVWCDNVG